MGSTLNPQDARRPEQGARFPFERWPWPKSKFTSALICHARSPTALLGGELYLDLLHLALLHCLPSARRARNLRGGKYDVSYCDVDAFESVLNNDQASTPVLRERWFQEQRERTLTMNLPTNQHHWSFTMHRLQDGTKWRRLFPTQRRNDSTLSAREKSRDQLQEGNGHALPHRPVKSIPFLFLGMSR